MKKILSIFVLFLVFLVGCQDETNGNLDTSKLNEIEMNNLTEEQKKHLPLTYESSTVKDGLDALPFVIKLPKKLPYDLKPFQPPTIMDMNRDGKKLMVEFKTFLKANSGKPIGVMISVANGEVGIDTTNLEEVKLTNDVVAYYANKSLSYNQGGFSYRLLYMNDEISKIQHKKEIIEIAKQMLH